MFGRIGKIILITIATEFGGALVRAGQGWIDRKLNPRQPVEPQPAPPADVEAGQ